MNTKISEMLSQTIAQLRGALDANSVVGDPITVGDNITIIPISKISVGLGGGGSDFTTKNPNVKDLPFGGGIATGIKATPVAFLVIKDGNIRMLPVAEPASTTADRIVEMIPDTLDKITNFIDSRLEKKAE